MAGIFVTNIFGQNTHKGLVHVTSTDDDGKQVMITCTPHEARAIAWNLLECAEAAQHEEMFVRFLVEEVHTPFDRALQILGTFRGYRDVEEKSDQ